MKKCYNIRCCKHKINTHTKNKNNCYYWWMDYNNMQECRDYKTKEQTLAELQADIKKVEELK